MSLIINHLHLVPAQVLEDQRFTNTRKCRTGCNSQKNKSYNMSTKSFCRHKIRKLNFHADGFHRTDNAAFVVVDYDISYRIILLNVSGFP